jgi:hypothetical protein
LAIRRERQERVLSPQLTQEFKVTLVVGEMVVMV